MNTAVLWSGRFYLNKLASGNSPGYFLLLLLSCSVLFLFLFCPSLTWLRKKGETYSFKLKGQTSQLTPSAAVSETYEIAATATDLVYRRENRVGKYTHRRTRQGCCTLSRARRRFLFASSFVYKIYTARERETDAAGLRLETERNTTHNTKI
jgi:hypothetical protein